MSNSLDPEYTRRFIWSKLFTNVTGRAQFHATLKSPSPNMNQIVKKIKRADLTINRGLLVVCATAP